MRLFKDGRSGRWLSRLALGEGRSWVDRVLNNRSRLVVLSIGLVLTVVGCTGFFQQLAGTKSKDSTSLTQLATWQGQKIGHKSCVEKLSNKELTKQLRNVLGKAEAKKLKKKLEQKGQKMKKERAEACRTRVKNQANSYLLQVALPMQEAGPDLTLVTIPFENTDGTSGALYDLQNEADPRQATIWAGIEQGERYQHLQGDEEKSYLFPGTALAQQAITDAQQSEGFQEIQADIQAQGLSLQSAGIQVVVDETEEAALLAIPATSSSAAPATELGQTTPEATLPTAYYYAWVYTDELITNGISQVQVGSLHLDPESLNWWIDDDLQDASQLMSPFNWTAKFNETGAAVTSGVTTCKQARGSFKVGNIKLVGGTRSTTAVKPLKLRVSVTGAGRRPYLYQWDFGDGSVYPDPSNPQATCGSTETRLHEFFNMGPPVASYFPQVTVTDAMGANAIRKKQVVIPGGPLPVGYPHDPNLPIVIVGGIGTTKDNPDYQKLVDVLHGLGYNYVYVVDWAPQAEIFNLNEYPVSLRHIPYLAVMQTQKQLTEKLGPDQSFIAVALSGGGVVMRFLIEHPGTDVVDPTKDALHNEGWNSVRWPPWYGDGKPDVAPCNRQRNLNECGGVGVTLSKPWATRVKKLYTMASPNNGTSASSVENCEKLTRVDPPYLSWVGVKLPALEPQWQVSCSDLGLNALFMDILGNIKPSISSNVEYISVGSDATDGLPYEMFNVPLHEIVIDPAPWDFYAPSTAGNFGFDGIVPAESPWVDGASHFILWDGDGPGNVHGKAKPKGTSLHHKCLIVNLWIWNRLIEHIEGRFYNRIDSALFGQLVYSREDAISGGTNANIPQPMITPPNLEKEGKTCND